MPQFVAPGALTAAAPARVPAFSTEIKDATALGQPAGKWPKTLDDARAEAEAKTAPRTEGWSAGEIAAAKSHCGEILKKIHAVATPEPPLKNGHCGAPAPIRLVSIGRNPEVALSPPAVVTCELAESLHTWVTTSLQPLAKRHLSAPIVKMEVMSDYSCRNAYGRAKARLSEHGRANALDIRSFVTAKSDTAEVLAHWGPTERDMRAQIAAANAATARAAAARAAAAPSPAAAPTSQPESTAATAVAVEPPAAITRGTIADGLSTITAVIQGGVADAKPRTETGFSLGEPARLGGPRTTTAALPPDPAPTIAPSAGKARFLREAHASACQIFGTALGPEANNAHRNHLHVDAAVRASGSFCQ
ncbi:MAG: extensin family protein [Pseudomonadota bacterium]